MKILQIILLLAKIILSTSAVERSLKNSSMISSLELSRISESPLPKAFGCLEKTDVTVLMFDSLLYKMEDVDQVANLIIGLNNLFVYMEMLQRIVEWNGQILDQFEAENHT